MLIKLAIGLLGVPIIMCALQKQAEYFVYVGTYSKGIYAYRFNADTGKLQPMGIVGEVVNPSFLTADGNHRYLYAVSEVEGNTNGGVAAFSINRKTGAITFLNSVSSSGVAPCHLAVDHTSKMLLVANYGTGGVSAFPIEQGGRLGNMSALMEAHGSSVNKERQEGPHAHETVISADNRFVYVPDLGLDQIRIYRLEPSQAKLAQNQIPFAKEEPGLGPRHIAFHPNGKFAYVANELKSVVTVFSHDASTGNLSLIQTISTVPQGFSGENAPAEILTDRAGNFVYASNRGHDSVAVFSIDQATGKLTEIQIASTQGKSPRGLEIDPTGHFLFAGNQDSNQFVVFRVDSKSGKITPTGQVIDVPTPVAFLFVPAA